MAVAVKASNKFEKMVKEQQHQFKLDLLEQVCNSMDVVFGPCPEDQEDPKPWSEEVKGRKIQFKKLEFSKQFGIIHLHFLDEDDKEQSYRLSLELKKA